MGAEVMDGGVHFRVWAPKKRRVDVVVDGRTVALTPEAALPGADRTSGPKGYFSALVDETGAGARYQFRVDWGDPRPDPASRSQPDGPHGASRVVDPKTFRWTDGDWRGVSLRGQVIYEMHVGTFTPEGTWRAAAAALDRLRRVCSVIEMMPVADFPGDFGWGYDGVDFFAPTRLYGSPDDLRAFVDRAHALGLGVILDVVYNHVGPDGNYLGDFSGSYFSEKHQTEWGGALNYDGPGSDGVREFFISNAGYWIDEYHFDGLRLDATQAIFDDSTPHVLDEIGRRVRSSAQGRETIVVVENEAQDARLIRPAPQGGYGLDAAWNDDLHHTALVALTGQAEAYFTDHRGAPQEFVSAAKYGYLFQGQRYSWQRANRGTSTRGLAPEQFVTFLENHDQVANTGGGRRLHARAHPAGLRALSAFVLLGPGTPMLFQGQEFASTAPFMYFAHHTGELAEAVRKGRAEFLGQFPSAANARVDSPSDPATFAACKLSFDDHGPHGAALAFHRDLFELRRTDATVRAQGKHGFDGTVLGPSAFALRLFGERDAEDRLLVVNLGRDLNLPSIADPLVAAPNRGRWATIWSSEDPRYGGDGVVQPDTDDGWKIRADSATLLAPAPPAKD